MRIIINEQKFNRLLENYSLEDNVYHGTNADFNEFDLAYLSTGSGNQAYGYGIYLAKDIDVAKSYGGKVYTTEIPDVNENNYVFKDIKPSKNILNKTYRALYGELVNGDYKGAEKELKNELNGVFNNIYDGLVLHGTISDYLGSDKDASNLLRDVGIYGIVYNDNGNECYVIFNPKDIKIIKKENV